MQMWMAEFKPTSSPPNIYSDYAIHIILRKMMEFPHLKIIIQKNTGKIKIHSALLLLLRPSTEQNGDIDLSCAPILIMNHFFL